MGYPCVGVEATGLVTQGGELLTGLGGVGVLLRLGQLARGGLLALVVGRSLGLSPLLETVIC